MSRNNVPGFIHWEEAIARWYAGGGPRDWVHEWNFKEMTEIEIEEMNFFHEFVVKTAYGMSLRRRLEIMIGKCAVFCKIVK